MNKVPATLAKGPITGIFATSAFDKKKAGLTLPITGTSIHDTWLEAHSACVLGTGSTSMTSTPKALADLRQKA